MAEEVDEDGMPAMGAAKMLKLICDIHKSDFRADVRIRNRIAEIATQKYRKTWADIDWCVDDVLQQGRDRGIGCSRDEAAALLDNEDDDIREAMIEAGARVIRDRLRDLDHEREDDDEEEDDE